MVADPLYAHGIVLLGAGDPIVLVSVDWCGIGNEAHDLWRTKLAAAAGTKFERVLVCSIHQHDAPFADLAAERLFAAQKLGRSTLDLEWHARTVDSVAAALGKSLAGAQPLTHIGTGQAKVERIASNRRILGASGKVEIVRLSASQDPQAQAAPEGTIDPWLKTLSFWNGDKALASISVYATHPMSYYGQGHVSSDFPGLARRQRQADDPGVLHFYANGCGGDLAAGKYNDGSPAARGQLAERLYQAWKAAWENTRKQPLQTVAFRSISYRLKPKDTAGFQAPELEALLIGSATPIGARVRAAYALSWRERCLAERNLDLPVLDFGAAQLLLLPGEPFVEYQLFAQKQRPDSSVLTRGYGDYGPTYIPYDAAFAEGGYEPGSWSFVGVGVEKQLKDAIAEGLAEPTARAALRPSGDTGARYELGRRTRATERVWMACADAARRKEAIPRMQTAVTNFFLFRPGEVARALDEAAAMLRGMPRTPAEEWVDALRVDVLPRVVGVEAAPIQLRISWLYRPQVDRVPLTLEIVAQVGEPPLATVALSDLPRDQDVQLPAAAEGDATLTIVARDADERELRSWPIGISRVRDLPARLAELETAAGKLPELAALEVATARQIAALVQRLADAGATETDFRAAALLRQAEDVVRSAERGTSFLKQQTGEFLVAVPRGRSATPVRVLLPREKPSAIVVALHGAGGSENMFFDTYGDGLIVKLCRDRGWALLAPKVNTPLDDFWGAVDPLIERLTPQDAGSRLPLFLVGHSLGCVSAIGMAANHPERVAAIVAISGGSFGDLKTLAGKPVFVTAGTQDFGRAGSQSLARRLEAAGAQVRWQSYEAEHLLIVPECLPDAFKWLDEIARGDAPK